MGDQKVQKALFTLMLLGVVLGYALLPKQTYSPLEKRKLADLPPISGDFPKEMEQYLSDHLPLRNFFLGVGAYWQLLIGPPGEIYPARGDRLLEAPSEMGKGLENIDYVNQFRQQTGLPVDLLLVPSAGFFLEEAIFVPHRSYHDDEILGQIWEESQASVVSVKTGDPESFFYRTDHHWTTLGAFSACNDYLRHLGLEPLQKSDFLVETIPDFYGSTYCRSRLWLTPPENLEIWRSETQIRVEGAPALFDMEKAATEDKYAVFLGGNQGMVRLKNQEGMGKILVLRDSFGSSFAPFLAQRFADVVLIDLRYYKYPVRQLLRQEEFDRVLVLYGLNTFTNDGNLVFLR